MSETEDKILTEIREIRQEINQFDTKFTNYQKATQWVVQLAFTLIASATLTVIITSVLKK
ncbi:MAG: hypothetical protein IGS48_02480 [Oscillatoriales cyanobacterium C42_A2020_001]|nr:hypothetical protein [Leptolyngbyaceae cyanobacterium C42_A2020_001]